MRRPTPFTQLYAWHRAYMAGENPERHETEAHAGWYKTRLIKQGPWVPVRIFVDRDIDPITGELMDDERLLIEVEGIVKGDPLDRWTWLTPISRKEYMHLMDYRLRDPRMLDGRQKIDLSEAPTLPQGVF